MKMTVKLFDDLGLTAAEIDNLGITAEHFDSMSYEEFLNLVREKIDRFKDFPDPTDLPNVKSSK